ncbi:MAG: sulfotransferase domain-containing protein [Actinobacteria bacterium]|nr:sulfotransferase domain-containing protein [Nocardioidaceae bacterium]MBA3630174.1 sulfotransferase domain-containing protein [Actinomycetota bacterium]
MTLPDVYLIGAPKAGTTSLARWLSQHPQVYFSVPKEPFYWASDFPRVRDHYGFATRGSYEALFDGPAAATATLRAEGSTFYIYSQTAVTDILSAVERPRFIVAVRDPVDLLISYHRSQLVALNEDEVDFEKAWRRSLAGRLPGVEPLDPKIVDYPRVGALGQAMVRLLNLVPRKSVHIVPFDLLATQPEIVWAELTRFLAISERPSPAFEVFNASNKMYRSSVLRRLTHRPPAVLASTMQHARQWSRTTSLPLVARVKSNMWRPETPPTIAPEIRAELADYFRTDKQIVQQLLAHTR